jgi:hypothetical protein
MIGDQNDMASRLRAVLPAQWFPDAAPMLCGLLAGLGQAASFVYGLIGYAQEQTRIATAIDGWLDLVAQDYFGARLVRQDDESDTSLRARIDLELLRPRVTRAALVKQIEDLTGRTPWLFEPMRPEDTGCWNSMLSYGGTGAPGYGGYGCALMPFQLLVVVYRAAVGGVPDSSGYGEPAGGYGMGSLEYAPSSVTGTAADSQILAAVASVTPTCGVAWTRLAS